jgi:hypothetical protein
MKASAIETSPNPIVRPARRRWAMATLCAGLCVLAGCGGGTVSHSPDAGVPPGASPTSNGTQINTPGAPPTGQAVSQPVPNKPPTDQLATGWRYRFDMISPGNDNSAITTREMYLFFKPDTAAVHFQVENRLGVAFKIVWDECTFVDVYGRSWKAVHRGITYDRKDLPQEPTWIQAGQRYADFIIPTDVLNDPAAATGSGIRTIVPTDLRAQSMIGKTFSCKLVFAADNNTFRADYDVVFKIVSTYRD